MKTAEEILREKTKDYTDYPSPAKIIEAMEEYGKQSYIEGTNSAHHLLLNSLAKEFNQIKISLHKFENILINDKLIEILKKYGYKG